MNKDYLRSRFPILMLIFTFGGIFGFIYEEIFYRFDLGEWVKRGTTFGPWIPIRSGAGSARSRRTENCSAVIFTRISWSRRHG